MDRAIARAGGTRGGARQRGAPAAAVPVANVAAPSIVDEARQGQPWRSYVVVLLLAVVAIRLHEVVPQLSVIRPALILGVGGFACLWLTSGKRARDAVLQDSSVRWVLLYAAWAGVTVPFALWPGQAIAALRGFFPAILLVAALLLLLPTERTVVRVLTGFVVASGAYAIALLTIGKSTRDGRTLLLGGTLDSNDVSLVMAMTFPLALGLISRAWGGRRMLCLVTAGILLIAATATGSRGGTLAFLVGSLTFVFGQRGGRKFVFLVLLMVGGAFAWLNASPSYRARMIALFQGEKDYNYTAYGGRKQIWARARGYTVQNPVLGVGVGNFPIAEGGYLDALGTRGKWSNTHNAYLQASSELGFPGVAIFLGLLIATGLRAAKHWRPTPDGKHPSSYHRPELLASVLAFATGSYFLSTAYFYSYFALVGLIALSDRVSVRTISGTPGIVRGRRSQRGSLGEPIAPAVSPGTILLPVRPN